MRRTHFNFVAASAAIAFALFAEPAEARTEWAQKYKTFAGTKCEAPEIIADMIEAAKEYPIFRQLHKLEPVASKTVRATANTLRCRVKFTATYGSGPRTISGTFTVRIFPNGGWRTNFDTAY